MVKKPSKAVIRTRLEALRAETLSVSQTSADSRRPVELDQQMVGRLSRMDALQGQAMQLETERRRGILLQRIDAALQRVEDGEYGYCLGCDEEIEAKRLEVDPTTPTCIGCAETGI